MARYQTWANNLTLTQNSTIPCRLDNNLSRETWQINGLYLTRAPKGTYKMRVITRLIT